MNKVLHDLLPQKQWWSKLDKNTTDVFVFNNLQEFKLYLADVRPSTVTQSKCGCTYEEAIKDLKQNKPLIAQKDYESIFNKVKNNLIKRGLISETVYENYYYSTDDSGIIDVTKVAEQNPECFLTPMKEYTSFFYELFINVTYPFSVTNEEVTEGISKILATIQLLEKEHIYIKVNLVFASKYTFADAGVNKGCLVVVPVFSHKDIKTIEMMSAVFSDRSLRKYIFGLMDKEYGRWNKHGYVLEGERGRPISLPFTIRPDEADEVDLANTILNQVFEKGTR